MPRNLANLDALIQRENFDIQEESHTATSLSDNLRASELERGGLWYSVLRKPEFQRETADWDPSKIAGLVRSYLDIDLIPALILWRSPNSGKIFVIDGAHRLGALLAWVLDDYGDGDISTRFFQGFIPPEQQVVANKTRKLINNTIGSYREIKSAATYPENASEEHRRLANNLAVNSLQIQWVPGNATKAEDSYYRINQNPVLLDPTELEMIKGRNKPNALATRALIRAGTGHKYWSRFPKTRQEDIENLAKNIYDILFVPAMATPIKNLEQPTAGRGYSAESVKMVYELVNYVNRVPSALWKGGDNGVIPDDETGEATSGYLNRVKKTAERISGTDASSLGLHPFVYFYGATGRFQPTAFLATIAFIDELEQQNALYQFTENRSTFEEFVYEHRHYTNQIARNFGSFQRGLSPTLDFYQEVLAGVTAGEDDGAIINRLKQHKQLSNLTDITEGTHKEGRAFSSSTKAAVIIQSRMATELRCNICNARLPSRSMTFDHEEPRGEGGAGTQDNAQLAHAYCNTGFKERQRSKA